MRRTRVLVCVILLGPLTGCWLQPRADGWRTNSNDGESQLTSGNAAQLVELWEAHLPGALAAPVSTGGRLYVSTGSGTVAAFDGTSGAQVWRQDIVDATTGATPHLSGPAFVHRGFPPHRVVLVPFQLPPVGQFPGGIYELDATSGTVLADNFGAPVFDLAVVDGFAVRLVSVPDGAGGFGVSIPFGTGQPQLHTLPGERLPDTFAITDDWILWWHADRAQGYAIQCDASPPVPGCSDPEWSTDLGGEPAGPAVVDGERVVYADDSGTVSVLDIATGAIVWRAETGAPIEVQPAVVGETIVVATTDGRLIAFPGRGCGATTCEPTWQGSLGGAPSTAPAGGGDVVYAGTADGDVVAFARDGCGAPTCPSIASIDVGGTITGGPIIHDGHVAVGTGSGELAVLGLPGPWP
jgi:outer membrane protein assembly factor BamB